MLRDQPGAVPPTRPPSAARILWPIVTALVLRLVVVRFLYSDVLSPDRDFWDFGWETGRLARSVASGHGFSSPLFGDTGPSAWMTPLYPLLLAAVFKLFGIYSRASAFVALGLNSLFSTLTCAPVFYLARRIFSERVARVSAWFWAFFPYAVYFSAGRVWENALTTLLFSIVLLVSFRVAERPGARAGLLWGVLWGLAALSNPIVLSTLPVLVGWILYRSRREWPLASRAVGATVLGLLLAVTPWFVRNYRVFGRFIPFRANFWLEVRVGNTGDTSDLYPDWSHPSTGQGELLEYQRLGELRYMAVKKQQAIGFIRQHPGEFAWLTLRRIFYTWTGFWSWDAAYVANEPTQFPNLFFCGSLTVLLVHGVRKARRNRMSDAIPLALTVFVFPLIFYVTHSSIDYRHPIDPAIVILISYFLVPTRK